MSKPIPPEAIAEAERAEAAAAASMMSLDELGIPGMGMTPEALAETLYPNGEVVPRPVQPQATPTGHVPAQPAAAAPEEYGEEETQPDPEPAEQPEADESPAPAPKGDNPLWDKERQKVQEENARLRKKGAELEARLKAAGIENTEELPAEETAEEAPAGEAAEPEAAPELEAEPEPEPTAAPAGRTATDVLREEDPEAPLAAQEEALVDQLRDFKTVEESDPDPDATAAENERIARENQAIQVRLEKVRRELGKVRTFKVRNQQNKAAFNTLMRTRDAKDWGGIKGKELHNEVVKRMQAHWTKNRYGNGVPYPDATHTALAMDAFYREVAMERISKGKPATPAPRKPSPTTTGRSGAAAPAAQSSTGDWYKDAFRQTTQAMKTGGR